MQDFSGQQDPYLPSGHQSSMTPPPQKRGSRIWIWLLVGGGVLFCLPCGGIISWIFYLGAVGPETSVYTGNQVPASFVATMKDVGALDDDESISYFYSDGLSDIRDGFYFVSDKKVVVYSESTAGDSLTIVEFEDIESIDLYRDESFFEDSVITLQLKDGQPVSFPVSSEVEGDMRFHDAINERIGETSDAQN